MSYILNIKIFLMLNNIKKTLHHQRYFFKIHSRITDFEEAHIFLSR